MRLATSTTAIVAALLFSNLVLAQSDSWKPSSRLPVSLADVGIAKVYKNNSDEQVLGLVRSLFRYHDVFLTKHRLEVRTRTVPDETTGTSREEQYTVPVPFNVKMEGSTHRSTRLEVPIEHVKVWDTHGNQLEPRDFSSALQSPKRCFFITGVLHKDKSPVDSFIGEMLSKDVLIVWFDTRKTVDIEP